MSINPMPFRFQSEALIDLGRNAEAIKTLDEALKINPSFNKNCHDGFFSLPVRGPTIPKPSVALCAPKPIIKSSAQVVSM